MLYGTGTSVPDEVSKELSQAWSNAFGRDGNPSDAWDHAIKAVEDVLIPEMMPRNTKATLGTVLGELTGQNRAQWKLVLPGNNQDHDVAHLVAMLRLVWPNHDRHCGATKRRPSEEEARAVVTLAAAIVQWHRQGWVVQKRQQARCLLGNEGSGYWVAREAVCRTLARVDRGERVDHLGQQLAADYGLQVPEQLLDHFYAQPDRRYWAGRARVVFELAGSGDPQSCQIVEAAARELAELAIAVGSRLDSSGPVVLAGGLVVHQPTLQKVVRRRLVEHHFTDVRVLAVDPVRGAVELAQRLLLECEPTDPKEAP